MGAETVQAKNAVSAADKQNSGQYLRRSMFGRRVIRTSAKSITAANVVEEVRKAMLEHAVNQSDIDYLWNYYKGKQPILSRTKQNRPDICNNVVSNHANEIVTFKTGYLVGEPVQYVGRNVDEKIAESVGRLNDHMLLEDKAEKDRSIVSWQMICGTAYRIILPRSVVHEDESPFELHTLDPRETFVVRSTDIGGKPMYGVKYSNDLSNGVATISVYTEKEFFLIRNDEIVEHRPHAVGAIPIIEYPANDARLGAFEIVLPLLDSINAVESNRVDGIEQFVQAFIKFINCDISAEDFEKLRELGGIKVKSQDGQAADVDIVSSELNQSQAQTLKEDLYQSVLTICGMPSQSGNTSSTSDTGSAVSLRNGWESASSRASASEGIFKKSEREMLRIALRICRELDGLELRLSDLDIKFTRRNYEGIQSKSQVLVSMLSQPKIHPLLAFTHCGMFSDPEDAYSVSAKYYEEQLERWEIEEKKIVSDGNKDINNENTVRES